MIHFTLATGLPLILADAAADAAAENLGKYIGFGVFALLIILVIGKAIFGKKKPKE